MNDEHADVNQIQTLPLTSPVSDVNTAQEHTVVEYSAPQNDYQQSTTDNNTDHEQTLNENYPSNSTNNYESEAESDVQDQQPIEATDDSNDPNHKQKDPVEKTIEKSLHPQSSQERDDILSPVQETFSCVLSDIDSIYVSKPTDSTALVYRDSLCEPCTDEKDEISIIKQTITTTEYVEIKKNKNDIGHIMISYNHTTKPLCSKIAKELKHLNYLVWIDQDNISGDVLTSMASAVENAFVVLMAINEPYFQSRYCRLEAEYSVERNKASIPMLMQTGYKAAGWLGIINGSKLYIDFSQLPFEEAFNLLRREIESVRNSLGADEYDQTSISTYASSIHSITTMNNSWNHLQNVHEWNADDVIEWLNREKLEVFQNTLSGFTGATLWQLFKIKFDSAPDYYRTVEQLLLPTVPHRLFYNLTFNAALETLFSSSNQSIQRK